MIMMCARFHVVGKSWAKIGLLESDIFSQSRLTNVARTMRRRDYQFLDFRCTRPLFVFIWYKAPGM